MLPPVQHGRPTRQENIELTQSGKKLPADGGTWPVNQTCENEERFNTEDTDAVKPRQLRAPRPPDTDLHAPTPKSCKLHREPVELEVPGVRRITLLASSHSCSNCHGNAFTEGIVCCI